MTDTPTPTASRTGLLTGALVTVIACDVLFLILHTCFGWSLINLDEEGNLTAWYSSAKLLALAYLAARCFVAERAMHERTRKLTWLWLCVSLIFLFLSADETASMHERLARTVMDETTIGLDFRETVLGGDAFKDSFAWVLLLTPAILAVAVFLFVFFFRRFRRSRLSLRLATLGVALFCCAVAMEATIYFMPRFSEWTGHERLLYHISITIEEASEVFGSTCLLFALVAYLRRLGSTRPDDSAT